MLFPLPAAPAGGVLGRLAGTPANAGFRITNLNVLSLLHKFQARCALGFLQ